MTIYSDAHCHLHRPELSPQLEDILRNHPSARLVCAAATAADWPLLSSWSTTYRSRYPAGSFAYSLGYHPQEAHRYSDPTALSEALQALERALESALAPANTALVALGEMGLDRTLLQSLPASERPAARQAQLALLTGQLRLAQRFNLPVILHNVRCHEDLLGALKQTPPPAALLHGFYGEKQILQRFASVALPRGLYISPNANLLARAGAERSAGPQPYQTWQRWCQLAQNWPRERFLIETDSCLRADGSPTPPRDTQKLAAIWSELWELTTAEVQSLATANLQRFCSNH